MNEPTKLTPEFFATLDQELAKMEGLAIRLEQRGEEYAAQLVRWAIAKIEKLEENQMRVGYMGKAK